MKAISPMVAVVLLIAFTIGVGGLISIFVIGLTKTSTGVTSNQSESISKCANVYIKIDKVTRDTIIYHNPSPQTITSITGYTSDGTSINITGSGVSSLTLGQTSVVKNVTEGIQVTNETINFAANNTYYPFANSPVTSVSRVENATILLTSGNYTSNSTHIALVIVNPGISTGNYNVTYIYNGPVRTFFVGTNTSVLLRGLCQTIITVEGKCAQGQSCWEA